MLFGGFCFGVVEHSQVCLMRRGEAGLGTGKARRGAWPLLLLLLLLLLMLEHLQEQLRHNRTGSSHLRVANTTTPQHLHDPASKL
jgi:hypothetical protein